MVTEMNIIDLEKTVLMLQSNKSQIYPSAYPTRSFLIVEEYRETHGPLSQQPLSHSRPHFGLSM